MKITLESGLRVENNINIAVLLKPVVFGSRRVCLDSAIVRRGMRRCVLVAVRRNLMKQTCEDCPHEPLAGRSRSECLSIVSNDLR